MRHLSVLVVAVGICLIGGAAQPPAGPAPQPAPQNPWANKFFLPDIAINREQTPPAEIRHNFGDVPHGMVCVQKFAITNIYDVPMQITEVRKSCTCLDYIPMTRILQPNESADFVVTMNAGKFVGYNAQTFYITFGPKYVSTAVIRVSATSRTDVSINPGNASFGVVAQGSRASQSLTIKYSGKSRDWRLTEVEPIQGPFEVKVAEVSRGGPLRGGAEYQVDVTLKPTAAPGPLSEQIGIKTNDAAHPVVQLMVTGTITAPLEVAPNKVRLDPVAVGQATGQRVSIRAARPFRIIGVEGEGDGVSVELPPTGAAGAPVPNVQVITVKFEPATPGVVSRVIRVRTDLDGSIATIPIVGEAVRP